MSYLLSNAAAEMITIMIIMRQRDDNDDNDGPQAFIPDPTLQPGSGTIEE